jgi:hypothetical protein
MHGMRENLQKEWAGKNNYGVKERKRIEFY